MTMGTGRVAAVSLSAATVQTLVQFVPAANAKLKVIEIGISFDDTTTTDAPVAVDLCRQSTAGTSSSLTLVKDDETDSASLKCTALKTFTVEPTLGDILRTWHITPIGGLFVIQFPFGREPAALANRIAIRANAPQAQTVTAYLTVDE